VPLHPLGAQEHPLSPLQVVDEGFALQGVTVPLHVDDQVQPYSAEQAVDVVFVLQGVTVPLHVPGFQLHPYWYWQFVCVVSDEHAVSVPVHAVVHVQPALLQRLDDA
jgi:hypothetical protein